MNKGKKITWKILDNGCWKCTSHINVIRGGYLLFMRNKTKIILHRYIYEFFNGKIPKYKIVRHKCDNPWCINPNHLILGTQKENMQDMVDRGRSLYGERNLKSKLDSNQAKEIYLLNLGYKEIAKKYNISKSSVNDIKNRRHWKRVTKDLIKNSINKF